MIDFTAARTAMVDCQVRPSDVTLYPVIEAMLSTPREEYVPRNLRSVAYAADHLGIGEGRYILDSRVMAKLLDALAIQPNELVLDIGCGLGYSTALIAHLAEMVIAVEADENMAAEAGRILVEHSADNALVLNGVLADGAVQHGPYDVIVIEGGVEDVPEAIIAQLKVGGRMAMIRMQGALGQCVVGHKTENGIDWRRAFDAAAPVLGGFNAASEFLFT